MKIIDQDIQTYTAYQEFAYDGLRSAHCNDEPRFKAIIWQYKIILEAMKELKYLEENIGAI